MYQADASLICVLTGSHGQPEVQALLDLGLLDGGSENPEAVSMLLSDLRVAIVAYRAFRMLQKEV